MKKPRHLNSPDDLLKVRFLIQDMRQVGDGTVATLRRLVSELNTQMRPIKTWGWRYVHQVEHDKIKLSPSLKTAIDRLYEKRRLVGETALQQVTVLAPAGYAQHNSILRAHARECARVNCKASFIPNSPAQVYCSPECRKQGRRR